MPPLKACFGGKPGPKFVPRGCVVLCATGHTVMAKEVPGTRYDRSLTLTTYRYHTTPEGEKTQKPWGVKISIRTPSLHFPSKKINNIPVKTTVGEGIRAAAGGGGGAGDFQNFPALVFQILLHRCIDNMLMLHQLHFTFYFTFRYIYIYIYIYKQKVASVYKNELSCRQIARGRDPTR